MFARLSKNPAVRRAVVKMKMRLNSHPRLKRFVSRVRFLAWKAQVRLQSQKTHPAFDPHRTSWVSPGEIRLALMDPQRTLTATKYASRGKVVGGDWDLRVQPFDGTVLFRSFEAHFSGGVPWKETPLYRESIAKIEAGDVVNGCISAAAFDDRCAKLDVLFGAIRDGGYRPQADRFLDDPYSAEDEVSVCIGRHGDALWEDGKHRLAMAKILGIPQIPIKTTMVHLDWHRFRMEVLGYMESHGELYQKAPHWDLAGLPSRYGDERFELMKAKVPPASGGTLLDIGSHWGYFPIRFAELGYECHAVESSARNAYFMERFIRAAGRSIHIHNCSAFEYAGPTRLDLVLALSIFHHFLKDRSSYEKLIAFLGRLEVSAMLFEPHLPGDHTMVGSFRDFAPDDFVEFVKEHARMRASRRIGQAEDGRPLYLLTR